MMSVADADDPPQASTDSGVVALDDREEQGLLFDASTWKMYESTVRTVLASGRVMRKVRAEDVASAVDYLLANRAILPLPSLWMSDSNENVRSAMSRQKEQFRNVTGLDETQYTFAVRTLTYMGDFCAKQQSPGPLLVAWHKLREAGMVPRENCISTYLYVLGLEESYTNVSGQVAKFHDVLYDPNEKTVTLRIKSLIAENDAAAAEELLLRPVPKNGKLGREWTAKLRTFLPILNLYCSTGDVSSALRLYRQMRESPGVIFEPETYATLIGALAENGWFCRDAEAIEGATNLGFSVSSGPRLFDELVEEMAEAILELNDASARILYKAFAVGFHNDKKGNELLTNLEFEELPVESQPAEDGELIVSRVMVDRTTAKCPRSGAKLRLFRLEEEQRKQVHDTLLEMAATQYDEFREKLEARFKQKFEVLEGSEFAVRELSRFSKWLDEREGPPFSAIVDGPNVAYFGHGDVHYSQVKLVVEQLEKLNENALVIMPQKYVAPKFNLYLGNVQVLGERDLEVMNDLIESGKLYIVPSRLLDDFYWMLASVSNQTRARGETELKVSVNNGDGRFPGLRPILVTNDQMRDHKLDLLEPRLFRRWCSCHIVNYNFTDFEESEWEHREVHFVPVDFFSSEIQGNPTPDSNSGLAWHFPVSEWQEHERLCIRLPS